MMTIERISKMQEIGLRESLMMVRVLLEFMDKKDQRAQYWLSRICGCKTKELARKVLAYAMHRDYGIEIFIMSKFTPGDLVEIVSDRYHDIIAGSIGIVDCEFEKGYGVNLHAHYMIAGNDRGAYTEENRVMWFPTVELKKVVYE